MSRAKQDFLTWLLAVALLVSQATPWVPEKPYIVAGAFGLLGLPTIRRVQDAVAAAEAKDAAEAATDGTREPGK